MFLGTFNGRRHRSVCYPEKKMRLEKKYINIDLTVRLSSGIIKKMKNKINKVIFFSECNMPGTDAEFSSEGY